MDVANIEHKNCELCGKEFHRIHSGVNRVSTKVWARKRFCCKHCSSTYVGSLKKGTSWNKGLVGYMAGEKNCNWKGGYWCVDCGKRLLSNRKKDRLKCRCRNCATKHYRGKNSWNYKDGTSGHERFNYEYQIWRMTVYKRDFFTCQFCGKHGQKGEIEAHHIKPWKDFKETRFDINNGITLCRECHTLTRKSEMEIEPYITCLINRT